MIIVAHRGGPRVYPENSAAAINASFEGGADIVEIDIRLSLDKVPVVIHDDSLKRLFSIDRNVREISAAELTSLAYGHPEKSHLATLESTLQNCRKFPLLLHVREEKEGLLPILETVEKSGWSSKVVLGIVTQEALRTVKERASAVSLLAFIPSPEDLPGFAAAGVDVIRLWDSWITEERIREIHRHGILAAAMTGNPGKDVGETTAERLLELKTLGIDWVLVNDVQLGAKTLKHR
ncbi:MAG: glycerophosphodiester phosphodiesterase family protein [Syntrophales bacterium]|jgi:glycerophosphoryl diester phosphodiesterase|nr:glycerophosphodiester phosphodiesterase family protein [Syntrophales bacterium]